MSSPTISVFVDPPARSLLRNQMFNENDDRPVGDKLMAPWAYLRKYLATRGVTVQTADFLPEVPDSQLKLYLAISNLQHYRRVLGRLDVILSAFFALECPVVEPRLFRALPQVRNHFKRIISWSDSEALEPYVGERLDYVSCKWPQSFNEVHESIWRRTDRKFLVMINANKLPRLYRQELYTERMRAVEFFSRTGEIDLYGVGWAGPSLRLGRTRVPYTFKRIQRKWLEVWDRVRPDPRLVAARRVYRGLAASKAEVLGQYHFALCFENMILKGWMTEKLFDCFFAGTVPVYWGTPDIAEHVPAECFIDMRKFRDYEELRSFLKGLGRNEIQSYREAGREYLSSPQFHPFTKEAFTDRLARLVEEDTGVKL
jgi:hypothetical protein